MIALCEDREGNIWAGLHAREPNFFASRTSSFEPLLREGGKPNAFGESLVTSIHEDHQGALWVGTGGAFTRIDRRTGRHTSYPLPGKGFNNDAIAITEDHSGVIWVGTVGQGLNRFDRRTGRFKTYRHDPTDPSSLSNDIVMRLFIDHTGTMWLATWDGLNRFDPLTQHFVVYKHEVQNRKEYYYDVAEDQSGQLWLGGNSGLHRFDPQTGHFTSYEHRIDDSKSLSDNRVISVLVDRSGTVWAATEDGLDKLDREKGTFTSYYEKDGLPSNAVSCILEDRLGKLWMSTNRGLSRLDPLTTTFKNYSTADGLPGMDLTGWGTCFKSPSGEMFFGGFSGATTFRPDRIVDSLEVPPIVFTDFRLSGRSAEIGGNSPLKKSITYTHTLALSHNQNNFSLEFAALTFSSMSTRYRYKLDGLDPGWNETGSDQRTVNYTALPAGAYTFRVQIATGQGGWSEPGASLGIKVLPPWWSTSWFRASYISLILISVWSAYRYRLVQIAKHFNVRLEDRLAERTRIARELHTLARFSGTHVSASSGPQLASGSPNGRNSSP